MSSDSAFRRYIDDLLHNRRPHGRSVDPDDDAALRAAIDLRAAQPGGDTPSDEFVAALHRRLAAQFEEPEQTAPPEPGPDGHIRRRVVIGASVAAAAVAGGVAGHTFAGDGGAPAPVADHPDALRPNSGTWQAVASASALPTGATKSFDLGSVNGFVHRSADGVVALSGICTHQGCRLRLDPAAEQLRCPCHVTAFALTGQVAAHQLPVSPAPLPRLPVRESNGTIEVFAPND